MNRRKIIAVLVSTVVAAWVLLGYKLLDLKEKEDFYGFYVGEKTKQHSLTSHNGKTVSFSDLKGEIKLINFGYTNCPDICPTTLARLRQVYEQLGETKKRVDVIFITVDPQRDTVTRLGDFVPYFHEDFIGLTGSDEQIKEVSSDFNVHYFREDVKSEKEYLLSHNPSVFLVNREGTIVLKYPQNMLDPEKVVKDIRKIL